MATNPIDQFPPDTQELLYAILDQAPNPLIAAALMIGAYGESGWNPYAVGSGGAGAFGFTPPSYPLSDGSLPPAQQVAIILPAYLNIPFPLPASVTNPAAQAEWIAIAAERPQNDTQCLATIEATNAPCPYAMVESYAVQNWDLITQIVALQWPPLPPEAIGMFFKAVVTCKDPSKRGQYVAGTVYEAVPSGGIGYFYKACSPEQVAQLPAGWVVTDVETNGVNAWLNRWPLLVEGTGTK